MNQHNIKRFEARTLMAAMAGVAALVASSSAFSADKVVLKLSSFEPPVANITSNVLTPFTRNASDASGGTLQIDVFAGGTLGRNPTQQLKLVTDGVADLAWIVLPYTPGRFEDTDVVALPFLANNALESSVALERLYEKNALTGFSGLKMLAVAATPPVSIHGQLPIRQPDDLRNKRVRASGDHLLKILEGLGAAPVQLGAGQIAESLSKGVVDATLNNWGFVGDFKVNEVTSQHFDIALGAVAVGVVMREDKFQALPEAARAAITKFSGETLARSIGLAFDRQEKEVRDMVSKSGRNTVVTPSAAEVAAWRQKIEPINEQWRKAKPQNEGIYAAFTAQVKSVRDGR